MLTPHEDAKLGEKVGLNNIAYRKPNKKNSKTKIFDNLVSKLVSNENNEVFLDGLKMTTKSGTILTKVLLEP